MNVLLDTHILLWTLSNDAKLPEKARKLIENENNEIYYSIISLWEVEIKHLTHPDAMPVSAKQLTEYCMQSGFQKISVKYLVFQVGFPICLKTMNEKELLRG